MSLADASVKLRTTPALAQPCKLAFLRPPPSPTTTGDDNSSNQNKTDDFYEPLRNMSGCLLHDLTWGRNMKALILGVEQSVTTTTGSSSNSHNNSNHHYNNSRGSKTTTIVQSYVALYPESYSEENHNHISSHSNDSMFPIMTSSGGYNALGSSFNESGETDQRPSLGYEKNIISVNEEILNEGLAILSSRAIRAVRRGTRKGSKISLLVSNLTSSFVDKLETSQEMAHKGHLNLFRYGDPGDDSDDDYFGDDNNNGYNGGGSGYNKGNKSGGDKDNKNSNTSTSRQTKK